MRRSTTTFGRKALGSVGLIAGLLVLGPGHAQLGLPALPPLPPLPVPPLPGGADPTAPTQTLSGAASALTAGVPGNVTNLASTGTLTAASEPLGAVLGAGAIPGLVSAEALHAVTMAWPDQVVSESSLGNLAITVAGTLISADLVMSQASAVSGAAATGASSIEGLSIAGSTFVPTGAPNQVIWLPGLKVILNEQLSSAGGGIVVNALHVTALDGLTDLIVGSAQAGI